MNTNDSFSRAFKAIQAEVERFAMFVERDRDGARDLVHEALVTAIQAWAKISNGPSLKAYLITSMLRIHRRGRTYSERFEVFDLDSIIGPVGLSPEDLTDMNLLRDAIAKLPDSERIPFVLAEIEGWSMTEISIELGVGLSAVKMRVKRGRDKLQKMFQEKPESAREESHV